MTRGTKKKMKHLALRRHGVKENYLENLFLGNYIHKERNKRCFEGKNYNMVAQADKMKLSATS